MKIKEYTFEDCRRTKNWFRLLAVRPIRHEEVDYFLFYSISLDRNYPLFFYNIKFQIKKFYLN